MLGSLYPRSWGTCPKCGGWLKRGFSCQFCATLERRRYANAAASQPDMSITLCPGKGRPAHQVMTIGINPQTGYCVACTPPAPKAQRTPEKSATPVEAEPVAQEAPPLAMPSKLVPAGMKQRLPRPVLRGVMVEGLVCGKRFVQNSWSPRLYCDAKCQAAAYRARKEARPRAGKPRTTQDGPDAREGAATAGPWGEAHPIGRYRTASKWPRTPSSACTEAPKTFLRERHVKYEHTVNRRHL